LLSGFAFPLDSIQPRCSGSARVSWPVHGDISRRVFLKGAGFAELWPGPAALAEYAGGAAGIVGAVPQEVGVSLHRIRLIIWKEFLQLRRDPLCCA
jgi:hypothetical protein